MKIFVASVSLLSFFCTGCMSTQGTQSTDSSTTSLVETSPSLAGLRDRPETSYDVSVGTITVIDPRVAGQRVAKAYGSVRYFRFIGTITQKSLTSEPMENTGPYFVFAEMSTCRLRLFTANSSRVILGESILQGTQNEWWSKDGEKIVTSPSPYPQGSDNVIEESNDLVECVGCLIGSCLSSWVGDYSGMKGAENFTDQRLRFKGMIEQSKQLPDARIMGKDCYVFKDTIPVGNDERGKPQVITHTLFIDQKSDFVVGWDTAQPDVLRTRRYDIVWSDFIPPADQWLLVPQRDSKMRIIERIKD